jgi:hypothetical protein
MASLSLGNSTAEASVASVSVPTDETMTSITDDELVQELKKLIRTERSKTRPNVSTTSSPPRIESTKVSLLVLYSKTSLQRSVVHSSKTFRRQHLMDAVLHQVPRNGQPVTCSSLRNLLPRLMILTTSRRPPSECNQDKARFTCQ